MRKIIMLIVLCLCLCSCTSEESFLNQIDNSLINEQQNKKLLIDLKGEVVFPNIYNVDIGTTIYELVILAGGFTNNANTSNINLASILEENQMIIIPSKNNPVNSQNNNDLININIATINELCELPGIGTAKAKKIIEYRNLNGNFITIIDIKKVSGIGEELFNKIKVYICV